MCWNDFNIFVLKIFQKWFISLQSNLSYGLLLWGIESNKILTLQKKAIRGITCSKVYSHTEPLFKDLNILKINDLYNLRVLKICYKIYNKHCPVYFLKYLDFISDKCVLYNFRKKHTRTPMHNPTFARSSLLLLCYVQSLMIIERSPNRPTDYADNLSLHVSSKGITLAGSVLHTCSTAASSIFYKNAIIHIY